MRPSAASGRKASAVAELELAVRHDGVDYVVVLDVTWERIDDSFDHDRGTEKDARWEPFDYEIVTVLAGAGEEIDEFEVDGLCRAIRNALDRVDYRP